MRSTLRPPQAAILRMEWDGRTHLGLLVLRVVLPIDVARRRLVRHAERGVADLRREVVF